MVATFLWQAVQTGPRNDCFIWCRKVLMVGVGVFTTSDECVFLEVEDSSEEELLLSRQVFGPLL